jgi:hypothetical protein
MAAEPFELLLQGDPQLLQAVEALVVDMHQRWYESSGRSDWSEPKAYQWLHYEDPDPVGRLTDGVRSLSPGVGVPLRSVDSVIELARLLGFRET